MDKEKLEKLLEEYDSDFTERWKKEKFKWEAIKHFHANWKPDAENFSAMLNNALKKAQVILNSSNWHPAKFLIDAAAKEGATVREMFRNLYEESLPLEDRVSKFQNEAERLKNKYEKEKNHFQNTSAISVYLWLKYPNKYYIYKYGAYFEVSNVLNFEDKPESDGKVSSMLKGFKMYDEIREVIKTKSGLIKKFDELKNEKYYEDSQYMTLTCDFGFYISQCKTKEAAEASKSVSLSDPHNGNDIIIWKISHGTNETGIKDEVRDILCKRNVAVVNSETKGKAKSKTSQGKFFTDEIKKGDFFYLCYGSEIQLLGQFTSESSIENLELKDGWVEREYRVIKESKDKSAYKGTQKWWTPNDNSTCVKVEENELDLFNELILEPYFDMNIDDLQAIKLDEKNCWWLTAKPEVTLAKYTKEDFLGEVFMDEEKYDSLESLLRYKKNVILQGAPGVGKTFAAKRLAYAMMKEKDDSRIEIVQFHQNYSYEDFIIGYRPFGAEFKLKEGIFYNFCQKASNDPENEYFFIIDEINRGNLSKIFGELMMLIEKDYRETKLTLAYTGKPFSVPKNLYIVGMMNTADRSLALIDYALRRRFSFFEMEPGFGSDGFQAYQKELGNGSFEKIIDQIKELNKKIKDDPSLGSGFQIGHSYFCGQSKEEYTDEWLRSIVEYEIIPMLEEYWFDENSKLEEWKKNLKGVFNDKR